MGFNSGFKGLKTDNAHIYYKHHFVYTMSFRHVSPPRKPSSGSTAHAFQQRDQLNELKGKAIPLQAWTGPEGFKRLRIPNLKTIGT